MNRVMIKFSFQKGIWSAYPVKLQVQSWKCQLRKFRSWSSPKSSYTIAWQSKVSINNKRFHYLGQIYLPSLSEVTMSFMSALLRGQKKFFRRNEVKSVIVPISPWLTVKKVISMVSKIPKIMGYLPDERHLLSSRTSRDYLFTIVHTLDPEFFPGAIKEIEELKGRNSSPVESKRSS